MATGPVTLRRTYKTITVASVIIIGMLLGSWRPNLSLIDGPVFDLGVAARWYVQGQETELSDQVAVVGVDWPSLEQPHLLKYPRALFGPFWGELLETLSRAEARVVAFDMVFSYSGNALLPNHDRQFLQALARNRDKVILGRTGDTVPNRLYRLAAGPQGTALTEVIADRDGVVRIVRPSFVAPDGTPFPTLSGAAMQKIEGRIPPKPVRYLPRGPLEIEFPTYRMADVVKLGKTADGLTQLRRAFAGRVVFVGTIVVEEDRKGAADRFLLRSGALPQQVSGLPNRLGISGPRTDTLPGVYLHAAAVDAHLTEQGLQDAPSSLLGAMYAIAAGGVAIAAVNLWLPLAITVALVVSAGLLGVSWVFTPFMHWYIPVGSGLILVFLTIPLGFGLRYLAEERRRAHIQTAFGHYVAPTLVAQMSEQDLQPCLGGEAREITCMFADLSGFTAMSTTMSATELMTLTNRYLDLITRAVDDAGGYVDKYIGDAVMALFNAPVDFPDHPIRAVEAARNAVKAVNAEAAKGGQGFALKVGLNTGPAVVGNMGTENRMNYTAVGQTVNIAARLEPLPPMYGAEIIVSRSVVERLDTRWQAIEIDWVRVKGQDTPEPIFVLVEKTAADLTGFMQAWDGALRAYRNGDFIAAKTAFDSMTVPPGWGRETFGPALTLSKHCEVLRLAPPQNWDGVWTVPKG